MNNTCGLALLLLLAYAAAEKAEESQCQGGLYDATISADRLSGIAFGDLPGFTRSVLERDHALLTPESRVYSPMFGWKNSDGAFLVTPAVGAQFSMAIVNMREASSSGLPPAGAERFVFLLNGTALVSGTGEESALGSAGAFAYFPPDFDGGIRSAKGCNLLLFERIYVPRARTSQDTEQPKFIVGNTEDQPNLDTPGEVFGLKKLLPASPEYDFNIHVMDFEPGQHLNVKELHYNQHGMIILQGKGIQRLSDRWYPVQAGDAMWMAPFVTQWYAALGKTRTRYLLYKDVFRDPLLA